MDPRKIMSINRLSILQDLGLDPTVPMVLKKNRSFLDIAYYRTYAHADSAWLDHKHFRKFFIINVVDDYIYPQYFDESRCVVRLTTELELNKIYNRQTHVDSAIGIWVPVHWIEPYNLSRLLSSRNRITKMHEPL